MIKKCSSPKELGEKRIPMHTISCNRCHFFRPSAQESFCGYLEVYIVFVCSECSTYFPEDANDKW